jgi:hypothetical protein
MQNGAFMIVVLNDNTKRLRTWEATLGVENVKSYSHPNYLFMDEFEISNETHVVIFDRFYYGKDYLNEEITVKIRKKMNKAIIVLSSGAHEYGQNVDLVDASIGSSPRSAQDLTSNLTELGITWKP